MPSQPTSFKALKRELSCTCSDPLDLAALALEQNERLKQRIRELESKLERIHR